MISGVTRVGSAQCKKNALTSTDEHRHPELDPKLNDKSLFFFFTNPLKYSLNYRCVVGTLALVHSAVK